MTLLPLGDQALLADLPDASAAVALATAARAAAPPWLLDVVPAYARVGVYFDADRVAPAAVGDWLRTLRPVAGNCTAARTHTIPVCYERGPDLAHVAGVTGLSADAVIAAHAGGGYTVAAVGFVPGFAYLGGLPADLGGVPRLPSPRVRVDPGMVGVTGRQTAVYPLPRPGGWPLVGQTPLTLVDVAAGYFPLRVGDRVRFARIDEAEFGRLAGERL